MSKRHAPQFSAREISSKPDLDLLDLWFSMSPDERNQEFADTARAAEMAGVSRRTLLDWINAGHLLSLQIGKRHHVFLRSLKAHVRKTLKT
jgi:hypothetical protein